MTSYIISSRKITYHSTLELDFISGLIQATRMKRLSNASFRPSQWWGCQQNPSQSLWRMVLTQFGKPHLLKISQGIHQICIVWEGTDLPEGLPGCVLCISSSHQPCWYCTQHFPLKAKKQRQEEAAGGPGVTVCLSLNTPFPPCSAGPMLPIPRAFLSFDSKQQVVK